MPYKKLEAYIEAFYYDIRLLVKQSPCIYDLNVDS